MFIASSISCLVFFCLIRLLTKPLKSLIDSPSSKSEKSLAIKTSVSVSTGVSVGDVCSCVSEVILSSGSTASVTISPSSNLFSGTLVIVLSWTIGKFSFNAFMYPVVSAVKYPFPYNAFA